jgi:hypothetical protein
MRGISRACPAQLGADSLTVELEVGQLAVLEILHPVLEAEGLSIS